MEQIIRIGALAESPWEEWLSCSETQLFHLREPAPGLFLAESPNVIERALAAGYQPESFLIDDAYYSEQMHMITDAFLDVPVYLAGSAVLNAVRGMHLTRGVLCAMQRREQPADSSELLWQAHRIALLENIMNPTNLGAVFRSAAALGIDAVLMTHGCTDPLYRRAARVSMGTVFQVPWRYCQAMPTAEILDRLRSDFGFRSAAMALCDDSVRIDDPALQDAERLVVVLGTEGEGLAPETIAACDYTVRIPMQHGVDSLNVAAASAVAFWELRRR
ncbi:MAG: RNA methyltransferase [Oscillospiraceae bacterium]|nr:RNA methyltransferase [Oscillospiraceae bacterium]